MSTTGVQTKEKRAVRAVTLESERLSPNGYGLLLLLLNGYFIPKCQT